MAAPATSTAPPAPRRLVELADEELEHLLATLDDEEAHALLYDWAEWGRPEQVWRPGVEKYTVYSCGRGWGKTRTGAEAVRWAAEHPREYFGTDDRAKWRIGIIGRTAGDVRKTMLYGPSGLMTISDPLFMPTHNKSEGTLVWPNGVIATTYSAEEPEQLRGPGFALAWCDELAYWKLPKDPEEDDAWKMVLFCLREAKVPGGARCVITTTPRPNRTCKELFKRARDDDPAVRIIQGNTRENAANVDASWLVELETKYKGTRIERQELGGDLLDDNPGALWRHELFAHRELDFDEKRLDETYEEFVRRVFRISTVVVAIDPSVSQGEDACETGIVVVGRGAGGRFYVLEDASVGPAEIPAGQLAEAVWSRRAIEAAWRWRADWITAEVNNGGNLVAANLRAYMHAIASETGRQPRAVPYQAVNAKQGKGVRAEPAAMLYDQGRVEHVGDPRRYRNLEDQCCEFDPRRPSDGQRCDRMDALVWALLSLSEEQPTGQWSTLDDADVWDIGLAFDAAPAPQVQDPRRPPYHRRRDRPLAVPAPRRIAPSCRGPGRRPHRQPACAARVDLPRGRVRDALAARPERRARRLQRWPAPVAVGPRLPVREDMALGGRRPDPRLGDGAGLRPAQDAW